MSLTKTAPAASVAVHDAEFSGAGEALRMLAGSDVSFVLVGSLAESVWGSPLLASRIDVVSEMGEHLEDELTQACSNAGLRFRVSRELKPFGGLQEWEARSAAVPVFGEKVRVALLDSLIIAREAQADPAFPLEALYVLASMLEDPSGERINGQLAECDYHALIADNLRRSPENRIDNATAWRKGMR